MAHEEIEASSQELLRRIGLLPAFMDKLTQLLLRNTVEDCNMDSSSLAFPLGSRNTSLPAEVRPDSLDTSEHYNESTSGDHRLFANISDT
jgi:hypothetical protein